jgi:hypothetical protein
MSQPPVRTVPATFTAHGSRERDLYGDVHFARIPPRPWCSACAFPGYLCTVSLPYPSGPSPCMWLSHTPTTMPHLTAWRASELSVRVSPAYLPTFLHIPCRLSRVRHGGLNQDGLGGTFLVAPSTLCGSPVPGESNQVLLSHLLQHRSCMLHRSLYRAGGYELDWLTHKVRCVRGSVPRRARRASGDSPCHLSAKRHLLATDLRLMASFRCMLLTLQSGLERLTPTAHWVPGYPMV